MARSCGTGIRQNLVRLETLADPPYEVLEI